MNSGPIFSVEAPKPAVSFPVCSASAEPMDEIQTRSQTFGFPSAPSISASIGFVAGSMPMCSKVVTLACPCMFDCPASMKTLSGFFSAAREWPQKSAVSARSGSRGLRGGFMVGS